MVWLAIQGPGDSRHHARREPGRDFSYHHPAEIDPGRHVGGPGDAAQAAAEELKAMGGDPGALLQVENAGPILGAAETSWSAV